jgi:hypothetical protein
LSYTDDPDFGNDAGKQSFAAAPAHRRAFQATAMMAALDTAVTGAGDTAAEQVEKVESVS